MGNDHPPGYLVFTWITPGGAQNQVISADVLLRASALRATDGGKSLHHVEHGYTGKAGTVNTWVGVMAPEFAS